MGDDALTDAYRVVLVEHDRLGLAPLAAALRSRGCRVFHVDAHDAVSHVRRAAPDILVIGKLSSSQGRGDLVRELREANPSKAMALFVALDSSKSVLRDHIIEQGADRCLDLPLTVEAIAAVTAQVRRKRAPTSAILRYEQLELRPDEGKLFVNGERVRLRPALMSLLRYFMEHPEERHDADKLVDLIGKRGIDRPHLIVAGRIRALRQSLGEQGAGKMIRSFRGRCYALGKAGIRLSLAWRFTDFCCEMVMMVLRISVTA